MRDGWCWEDVCISASVSRMFVSFVRVCWGMGGVWVGCKCIPAYISRVLLPLCARQVNNKVLSYLPSSPFQVRCPRGGSVS